uniref:F-box protein GID2 n=1 Tax=Lygodium japonicum TaxID=13824 RepID=A0A0B6VJD1_LYGJA|nr:F-box protein GID2 [Lygodium japonicum]
MNPPGPDHKRPRTQPSDRFWHHDEYLLQEVFKYLDAKSLAFCACVCRLWRTAAEEESLWERICNQNCAPGLCAAAGAASSSASPQQQFKTVVKALGGFRGLYAQWLRPLLSKPTAAAPPALFPQASFAPSSAKARKWSKDEVHLSLSLYSVECFERLGKRGSAAALNQDPSAAPSSSSASASFPGPSSHIPSSFSASPFSCPSSHTPASFSSLPSSSSSSSPLPSSSSSTMVLPSLFVPESFHTNPNPPSDDQ